MKSRKRRFQKRGPTARPKPMSLRIIGGDFGGRKIQYSGDPQVRPMKDRTREAVFNLIGPAVKKKHAIDLFAGTGAMAIEAISRGAISATLIERHAPSARLIQQNLTTLEIQNRANLIEADSFIWLGQQGGDLSDQMPWLIFLCPPYRFFDERFSDIENMIEWFCQNAPDDSLLIAEAEVPFDFSRLSSFGIWNVRTYRPAVVGRLNILRKADTE